MKKIFVLGILVLILSGFVWAQEENKLNVDRADTISQSQITSSPEKSEKENGKSYEKMLSIANISIIVATLVVGFVALLAAILGALGFYGYFQTGKMRGKITQELEEIKKLRAGVISECEMAKQQRENIEKIKTVAEGRLKEMEDIHKKTKEIAEKVMSIDKGIDEKKEATEKAANSAQAYEILSEVKSLIANRELDKADNLIKRLEELDIEGSAINTSFSYNLVKLGHLKKDDSYFKRALEKAGRAIRSNKNYDVAWYNKACAHSLLEDKNNTLESLKRAIELDSKYKKMAKEDEDFKWLWEDEDFKKLVE